MTTTFIVITRVPTPPDAGNMAALGECWAQTEQPSEKNGWRGRLQPLHEVDQNMAMAALLILRVPVFVLGEILIVESVSGREIGGRGRKPAKWDVGYEEFVTEQSAVARAQEAMKEVEA